MADRRLRGGVTDHFRYATGSLAHNDSRISQKAKDSPPGPPLYARLSSPSHLLTPTQLVLALQAKTCSHSADAHAPPPPPAAAGTNATNAALVAVVTSTWRSGHCFSRASVPDASRCGVRGIKISVSIKTHRTDFRSNTQTSAQARRQTPSKSHLKRHHVGLEVLHRRPLQRLQPALPPHHQTLHHQLLSYMKFHFLSHQLQLNKL